MTDRTVAALLEQQGRTFAEQIGISQMHVSRLLTKALAKLRVLIDDDGR